MSPALMLAHFLADVTDQPAALFRDAVVIYQTQDDKVGVLSYACCSDHSIKLMTYGIAIVVDEPQPPRAECGPG